MAAMALKGLIESEFSFLAQIFPTDYNVRFWKFKQFEKLIEMVNDSKQ